MTQKESIRDIILHQKKHDFVKDVLLNEQEREKISIIPKESNDLVNHRILLYRSYRHLTLGLSCAGLLAVMVCLLSLKSIKGNVNTIESKGKGGVAVAYVMGGLSLLGVVSGAVSGAINLRESMASHVIHKAYLKEQIKRQNQREKE